MAIFGYSTKAIDTLKAFPNERIGLDEVCNFPIETKARITLQTLFLRSTTKNYMYQFKIKDL